MPQEIVMTLVNDCACTETGECACEKIYCECACQCMDCELEILSRECECGGNCGCSSSV